MNTNEGRHSVVVVGQGYVGLPLSMAAVAASFIVTGIDVDPLRISMLRDGNSPVEDVSSKDLRIALKGGDYSPTDSYGDIEDFDYAIITVPTPLKEGIPNLGFIESAAKSLAASINTGCTIILESTTYPGTTEELLLPLLEKFSGLKAGKDFHLGYSPERIDPGNPQWNLLNTPKIVSGFDSTSLDKVADFYSRLGIPVIRVSGTREAEMTKLIENTFRHVNIALVNELAVFSRSLGVNIWEALEAAGSKPFGYMKFTPGPGVGGHCLPVDPSYLSWAIENKSGEPFRFVELANQVNTFMPEYVCRRLEESLNLKGQTLKNSSVLLVGLAYKPNTGDIRESPAIAVSHLLESAGATIYAIDEFVPEHSWPKHIARFRGDTSANFAAAVMLTNHSNSQHEGFLDAIPIILDTRNVLEGRNIERL